MTRSRILHELLLDFICDLCFRIAGAEQQQEGKRGRSMRAGRVAEEAAAARQLSCSSCATQIRKGNRYAHKYTYAHPYTCRQHTHRGTHTHSSKLGAGSFIDASMRDAKRVVCVSVAWLFHLQVRTSLE